MSDEQPKAAGTPATPQERPQGARQRGSRRAQRAAPEGVDPTPSDHSLTARATEDAPEGWGGTPVRRAKAAGENDERLKIDKPPHWG